MRRVSALLSMLLICALASAQVSQPITAESIGRRLYDRNAEEISAAVVPVAYRYAVGNVLRNGAICNGSNDDTTAIANALASSHYVWIPDGLTCLISASLTPRSGTTFEIRGNSTLLASVRNWSAGMVNIVAVNDVTLRGGIYDGRKALNSSGTGILTGVLIRDGNRIRVESATFQDMPSDSTTNGALGDGVYVGRAVGGPGSTDVVISNNRFLRNVRQGISVVAGVGVRIVGNSFIGTSGNNPGGGVDIEGNTSGDPLRGVAITGNYFEGNFYGVVLQQFSFGSVVTGNTFRANRRTDIYLSGTTNATITGNTIEANASDGTGVSIEAYTTAGAVLSGNTIKGSGTASANEAFAIRLFSGNTNISIVGNQVQGFKSIAIVLGASTMTAANNSVLVANNLLLDNVDVSAAANSAVIGISGNSTGGFYNNNVTVIGNQIVDTRSGGNEADLGISVATNIPAANAATYRIANNRISGPAAEFGTPNQRPGCIRVTYDAPSLSQNEAVVNGGQTITGAIIGDLIDVYPSIALGGVQATGYVTAADTAALMLENPNSTGAAINLANAAYMLCLRKANAL